MCSNNQKIPPELIEIKKYSDPGFKPMIDYNTWRVAVLNYIDELLPHKIFEMERHNETDEVFVLLKGEFILFLKEGVQKSSGDIYGLKLEPFKIYNVKCGVLHTHTLSKNSTVLIIENKNTSGENSTKIALSEMEQGKIIKIAEELFSK